MRNTKINSVPAAAVLTALLSACSSGGTVVLTTPASPAPCAPDTSCSADAVTVSVPVNVATGVGQVTSATGPATLLGDTTLTMALDPVTHAPLSATLTGAVNTSVTLAPQDLTNPNPGSFVGIADNGQSVLLTTFNKANLAIGLNGVGLSYADFGDWIMQPTATGAGTATYSLWAGGTQLTTTMPTTGSATYTGITRGYAQVGNTPYQLDGNLTLTANFTPTGGTITGNITNVYAATFPSNGIPGTPGVTSAAGLFNDIALSGTISGNAFSGTAVAGVAPDPLVGPHPAAIAEGTTGTTNGKFFGPAANEVSGVWSMSSATVQAAGSFGAK